MSINIRVCNVDEEGRFGGPERRIIQVADKLKNYGVSTHVVFPKLDSNRFRQELLVANVKHTALNITRLSKELKILFKYIYRFPYEVCLLSTFLKINKFDLVHVNGAYQFKTALSAKLVSVPVVWHLNDTSMDYLLKKVFYLVAHHCANGFIFAGRRVEKYYFRRDRLKNRYRLEIHAPVNTDVFYPESNEIIAQKDDQIRLVIATVSGVNPAKGLEYFVKMASKIVQNINNVKFLIAGSILSSQKKYTKRIFKLIEDSSLSNENFQFVGHVENVPQFLSKADLCVFTSVREASPMSIWEAMSMAKPIVTTDVGSVGQFIKNGKSGYIVPVGDVDALFERVKVLIYNPKLRKEMGQRSRKIALNKLNLNDAASKHAIIYKKIISHNLSN